MFMFRKNVPSCQIDLCVCKPCVYLFSSVAEKANHIASVADRHRERSYTWEMTR